LPRHIGLRFEPAIGDDVSGLGLHLLRQVTILCGFELAGVTCAELRLYDEASY